jgi:hypothetical protein
MVVPQLIFVVVFKSFMAIHAVSALSCWLSVSLRLDLCILKYSRPYIFIFRVSLPWQRCESFSEKLFHTAVRGSSGGCLVYFWCFLATFFLDSFDSNILVSFGSNSTLNSFSQLYFSKTQQQMVFLIRYSSNILVSFGSNFFWQLWQQYLA